MDGRVTIETGEPGKMSVEVERRAGTVSIFIGGGA
jgi:hypothetical protein